MDDLALNKKYATRNGSQVTITHRYGYTKSPYQFLGDNGKIYRFNGRLNLKRETDLDIISLVE